MQKIPLNIINGFLGSGKTTFLKNILNEFSEKLNIGIVQNEFAAANIDSIDLGLTGKPFRIMEVNRGSVFCVCMLNDFVTSLCEFLEEYNPDILFLESTGLSDPISVAELLESPKLSDRIFISRIYTIVDALNFEKLKFNTRVINQIRAADEIIINKIDLATNKIENTLNEVKVINPFAEIKLTSFCDIDFEKLQNDIGASAYKQLKTQKSLSNNKPDVETKVFKNHMKFDMDIFGNLLSNIGDSLFRLKGYLWETDNRIFAVQYVFGKISFQRIKNYSGPNLLVALGNNGSLDPLFNSIRSIAK